MFTSIFQSLSTAIGGLMDKIITFFLEALKCDLSIYLNVFPFLGTVYSMLQAIAFGMIAVIAGRRLAMFWLGSFEASAMQERPVSILLRSFVAAIGVYFGGYVLAFLTKWAAVPYEAFIHANGATASVTFAESIGSAIDNIGSDGALKDIGIALGEFLFLVLIAFNLFKLTIEVCERYMMVGVLVFTSPIAYPTIATKETSQIFKRWCSMFIGSLIMMSASVIFLKLIVSGLNNVGNTSAMGISSGAESLLRMLLVLALCKIAQRVDSYLQQLGIGVATTGGNMVDDILATAHGLRSASRAASRAGGAILGASLGAGAALKYNKSAPDGTRRNVLSEARKGAENGFRGERRRQEGLKDKAKEKGDQTVDKANDLLAKKGDSIRPEDQKKIKNDMDKLKAAQQSGNTGEIEKATNSLKASMLHAEAGAGTMQKSETNARTNGMANAEAEAAMRKDFAKGGGASGMNDETRNAAKAAQDGDTSRIKNAEANYEQFGAANKDGHAFEQDADGNIKPTLEAAAAGGGINDNDVYTDKVGGKAVSDWLAQANSAEGVDAKGQSNGGMPSPDDYINQQKATDAKTLDSFGGTSYLGHKDLQQKATADAAAYTKAVASGASAGTIAAAANKARESSAALYHANVESGQRRVDSAKASMDSAEKGSSEYKQAAREYKQAQESLDNYKAAYSRSSADAFAASNKAVVDSYQSSVPNSERLQADVRSAERSVTTLRESGASADQIQAAEQRLDTASKALYDAAVSYGSERVSEARQAMDNASQGSPEYKQAEADYRQAQESLSSYKSAYTNQSSGQYTSPYEEMASDHYEANRSYMRQVMDNTIESSDAYTKVRALENPHYRMVDNDNTRRIATDVFREAIPDMAAGSQFSSVNIRDLPSRSDNSGNYEMSGGRVIEVAYTRTDGSVGSRSFYDSRAATSLDAASGMNFASGKSVFKSADGSQWITNFPSHVEAKQSGRQVKETNAIRNFMALFKKKN